LRDFGGRGFCRWVADTTMPARTIRFAQEHSRHRGAALENKTSS